MGEVQRSLKYRDILRNIGNLFLHSEQFVEDERIIGFYGIISNEKETSLEYLYIEPESIGKGNGKFLWNHMINYCKNRGVKEIVLVTNPQAREFYIKMGAIQSGEVDSLVIKGRKIPRLVYTLSLQKTHEPA